MHDRSAREESFADGKIRTRAKTTNKRDKESETRKEFSSRGHGNEDDPPKEKKKKAQNAWPYGSDVSPSK